jgi:hypothetical protein
MLHCFPQILIVSSISLGKFGSFLTNELIGKPFGPSWEIQPDKTLKPLDRTPQDDGDYME